MTDYTDADLINLSNGQTLSYAALDQMLERLTVIEVAQELSVPFTELLQALKARHRT
ncbi:MAG: hypothetical protein Kow00121_29310 [Elainellaceae cyanobacterium]